MKLNNGLSSDVRQSLSKELEQILGTSYVLYVKAQKFHWNIEDELFESLHSQLEDIYKELSEFNDEVAERIRALGFKSPGSLSEFLKLSKIEENEENLDSREKIISRIINDYQTLIKRMRKVAETADKNNDKATDDLLSSYIGDFEQRVWMLRSQL